MKRYVDMADISDGRYYSSGDMVKAGAVAAEAVAVEWERVSSLTHWIYFGW
ncbi:MAG: hypothetical protein ACLSFZ_03770 [Frisingicoccus sp.]